MRWYVNSVGGQPISEQTTQTLAWVIEDADGDWFDGSNGATREEIIEQCRIELLIRELGLR